MDGDMIDKLNSIPAEGGSGFSSEAKRLYAEYVEAQKAEKCLKRVSD